MDECGFLLEEYDLEHNAYISLSRGKDSTVLHYSVDRALPCNKISRLFLNSGMERNHQRKMIES